MNNNHPFINRNTSTHVLPEKSQDKFKDKLDFDLWLSYVYVLTIQW